MSVKMRQRVEKIIARRVILDAIAAGFYLNVDNGGDEGELPKPSNKCKEVLNAMFATDDEHLVFYKLNGKQMRKVGWVYFVYGNDGWDVVNDYTTNLNPVMQGANELADKYS